MASRCTVRKPYGRTQWSGYEALSPGPVHSRTSPSSSTYLRPASVCPAKTRSPSKTRLPRALWRPIHWWPCSWSFKSLLTTSSLQNERAVSIPVFKLPFEEVCSQPGHKRTSWTGMAGPQSKNRHWNCSWWKLWSHRQEKPVSSRYWLCKCMITSESIMQNISKNLPLSIYCQDCFDYRWCFMIQRLWFTNNKALPSVRLSRRPKQLKKCTLFSTCWNCGWASDSGARISSRWQHPIKQNDQCNSKTWVTVVCMGRYKVMWSEKEKRERFCVAVLKWTKNVLKLNRKQQKEKIICQNNLFWFCLQI